MMRPPVISTSRNLSRKSSAPDLLVELEGQSAISNLNKDMSSKPEKALDHHFDSVGVRKSSAFAFDNQDAQNIIIHEQSNLEIIAALRQNLAMYF